MSTAPPDRPSVEEPRFRDALRGLPGQVWIVSLGILVNRLGNFLPVFMVLYLTGRGYSAGAAGFVLGVAGLGNVLGNAIGGSLADRLGRRWTIVLSAVTTAGLTAVVPFLGPFPIIVAVVGLIGVTSQLYRPAAAALLLDSVATNRQRLAAFAVFRFAMNIGAALGGVIGGVLASTSYVELFLSNAAACLLFGVVVAVLLRDAPRPRVAIGNLLIGAGLALTGFMTSMALLAAMVLVWTFGEMVSSSVANAYLGSLAPPPMVARYQGLYGVAYTIGTGAGPLIGGALYAIGPWALWTLVGAAGLLSAQLCLPRRHAESTVESA